MTDIPILFLIFLIILLIILSGFFSISETSMMALNRYKLKHDAKNKLQNRNTWNMNAVELKQRNQPQNKQQIQIFSSLKIIWNKEIAVVC